MESFLTKLVCLTVLGGTLLILLKVGNVYLMHRLAKEKAYANFKKKDYEALQRKKLKQRMELEDILLKKELEPYYLQARDLFHDALQARNLNHEQILYLKKVIDESLGDFINNFKYTRFQNDAHEIYTKLKSSHISISDFKRIIQMINTFEAMNEGVFIDVLREKNKTK